MMTIMSDNIIFARNWEYLTGTSSPKNVATGELTIDYYYYDCYLWWRYSGDALG